MRRSILQKIGEEEDGVMSELPYMRRNGVFCACVLGATTEGDWSKQKPRLYTIFELRHTGARARARPFLIGKAETDAAPADAAIYPSPSLPLGHLLLPSARRSTRRRPSLTQLLA